MSNQTYLTKGDKMVVCFSLLVLVLPGQTVAINMPCEYFPHYDAPEPVFPDLKNYFSEYNVILTDRKNVPNCRIKTQVLIKKNYPLISYFTTPK